MRRAFLAGLLGLSFAAAAPGCSGGVDTDVPANSPTPTPSGTATPTPSGTATATPTPTAPGLVGDPWTTTATPPEDSCGFGAITVAYGNAGVAVIGIATTGSNIHFDIGLNNQAIGVGDAPSGTVDSAGNFTQTFSYCTFDGASTYKYYGQWSGTFAADGLTFESTLAEQLYIRTGGDYRAMCATGVTTADAFGDCSSPGFSFAVHGEKQ